MAKLKISIAIGDYDRMRPLMDGRVHHGEGLSSRLLVPEELFHTAYLETHRI